MSTHSEAYFLALQLPLQLQRKMFRPEDLIFINPGTALRFMKKVAKLCDLEKDMLLNCIGGCEVIYAAKKEAGEECDMQEIVRGVVNPRMGNLSAGEKSRMRSLIYSLFGMRGKIEQGWKDARIVKVK